jgi:methylenetetrahydrofolate dehydrogenase (NADP+)/methenyltetrahydrofolate cyclohydrolase
MQLLDGKTAEDIKGEIAVEVQKMKNNGRKYLI